LSARGHEVGVAGRGLHVVHHAFVGVSVADRGLEIVRREPQLGSREGHGSRLGAHDVPRLGLAGIAQAQAPRVLVAGVQVSRQPLVAVQELDQQREVGAVARADFLAHQPGAELSHQRVQGAPSQRAVGNCGLLGSVVRDFPTLGDIDAARHAVFFENLGQAPATIRVVLQERMEFKWIHNASRLLSAGCQVLGEPQVLEGSRSFSGNKFPGY